MRIRMKLRATEVSRLAKRDRSPAEGEARPKNERPSRAMGRAMKPCLSPRRATDDHGPGRSPDLWRLARSAFPAPHGASGMSGTHTANHSDGIVGDFHPSSLFTPELAGAPELSGTVRDARGGSQGG